MAETMVNGGGPGLPSHFINHLTSYPIVSSSISTIRQSHVGQLSLEYAQKGRSQLQPLIPYLQAPYGYIAPYVEKADSLGNEGLNRFDNTVPKVIETAENVRGILRYPIQVAGDGTQHIVSTYNSERSKAEGNRIMSPSKAAVSTGLMLTSQYLLWLSNLLIPNQEKIQQNGSTSQQPTQNGSANHSS
ncbi:hypothetical protein FQN57_000013 [Myotisia sp. PD_48]|nr:hypothetical protein FQN57_000013 [Myotisia sp. PD_48]